MGQECLQLISKDWKQREPSSALAYFLQLDDKISAICVDGSVYYHFDLHARSASGVASLAAERCLSVSGKLYRGDSVDLPSFISEVMCRGGATSAYRTDSKGTVWALVPKEIEPELNDMPALVDISVNVVPPEIAAAHVPEQAPCPPS